MCDCPHSGPTPLYPDFHKDLHWLCRFLTTTDDTFIIHEDGRIPVPVFVDACSLGCGGCTLTEAYHVHFPSTILHKEQPICHLKALNMVVAVKLWAPHLGHKLIHLYSDNATAVAIFQAGRGRDEFTQACAREVWITLPPGTLPWWWDISQAHAWLTLRMLSAGATWGRFLEIRWPPPLVLRDFTFTLYLTLCLYCLTLFNALLPDHDLSLTQLHRSTQCILLHRHFFTIILDRLQILSIFATIISISSFLPPFLLLVCS